MVIRTLQITIDAIDAITTWKINMGLVKDSLYFTYSMDLGIERDLGLGQPKDFPSIA